jgi:hypothetical protein
LSSTISHDHDHDAPHAHSHDGSPAHSHSHSSEAYSHSHEAHPHSSEAHPHPHEQAPDNLDNLLLDIGGDTGALMIRAAADRDQAEIEISPVGGEQARTHNIIRRREAPSGAVYAAVFPAVPAGDYVVWHDAVTPAGTVTVHGGHVATFRL